MRYYWGSSEYAIQDIFEALRKTHTLDQLGKGGGWGDMLRRYILEASRPQRMQIWATEDKENAESYARATPELIFLVLDVAGLKREEIQRYLNRKYGKPHVVAFRDGESADTTFHQINIGCGLLIEPEKILEVNPVKTDGPDPYLTKLSAPEG
jgi:hypothetical protein